MAGLTSKSIYYTQFLAYMMKINRSIARRIANIRNAVPNFYSYQYDGVDGTHGTSIDDGGLDMYDNGNKVRQKN